MPTMPLELGFYDADRNLIEKWSVDDWGIRALNDKPFKVNCPEGTAYVAWIADDALLLMATGGAPYVQITAPPRDEAAG